LKDTPFVAGLESVPLVVGTLRQFGDLTVRVSAGKVEAWKAKQREKAKQK
jgi:hypothetical protein